MRLMEVDEAANHIRELVDPDANIIWGSAFNESLNGRIRVSVVATGIDVEAAALASKSQPFRLGDIGVSRAAAPAPAAPAPVAPPPVQPAPLSFAAEPEELDLGDDSFEDAYIPAEPSPAAGAPRFATSKFDDITGEDELVLDNAVDEPAPVLQPPVAAQAPAPAPAPAEPPKAAGGTWCERMSQLARGQSRPEEDDGDNDRTDFEVPRFLNRQNNQ